MPIPFYTLAVLFVVIGSHSTQQHYLPPVTTADAAIFFPFLLKHTCLDAMKERESNTGMQEATTKLLSHI